MAEAALTWRIGDIQVSRVPEFELPMMEPFFIYPGLTQAMLARHRPWLEPVHLDQASGRLVLSVHSFVVRTRRRTILVDACGGNDKERPSRPFFNRKSWPWLERLKTAGFVPEDIDFVLCTHLHADHVGWNTRLLDGRWVPTFPRARYLFTRTEWDHWRDEERRNRYLADPFYQDSILPVIESGQAEFVAMDYAFDDEAWLEPTPGHTPGHVALRLKSGGAEAVMSGDLMHTALQVAEPQLSSCFCVDPALSATTRQAFVERYADRPVLVMPAHFPAPSAGRIKAEAGSFRFHYAD